MFNFLIEEICAKGSPMLYIFQICRWVIRIIQIAVPFVLIIFGSLDFLKALMANDEKEMRQKRKPFITRIIVSIIIIFLPTLVNILLKKIAVNTNNRFAICWDLAGDYSNISVYTDNIYYNEDEEDSNSESGESKIDRKIDKLYGGMGVIITSGQGAGHSGVITVINKDDNTVKVILDNKSEIVTSVENIQIKDSTS